MFLNLVFGPILHLLITCACVGRSVISYKTSTLPIFNQKNIMQAENYNLYDSLDENVLQCYNEFSLASLIYFALKEGAASEQSSRMTAMDAASKNAGQ